MVNVLPQLRAAGWDPIFLIEPQTPTETPDLSGLHEQVVQAGCGVVVFQKVLGTQAVALVKSLEDSGVSTVFLVCDVVDEPMAEASSATVVVTQFLRSLYPDRLHSRMHVVHDGIEAPGEHKDNWGSGRGSRASPLTAALVTSAELRQLPQLLHPPVWLRVRIVGRYLPGAQLMLQSFRAFLASQGSAKLAYFRFAFDRRIQRIPWHPSEVYRELRGADIGLIPINTESAAQTRSWRVKSENRLTLKMAMGLPVVATPIPSYEDVIEHGVTGLFARTQADWTRCLEALRDPEYRKSMGTAARNAVLRRFSIDEQAKLFMGVLNSVSPTGVVESSHFSSDASTELVETEGGSSPSRTSRVGDAMFPGR